MSRSLQNQLMEFGLADKRDQSVVCQYCNKSAELVTGEIVYPHRQDLHKLNFYMCHSCDAYVGCHPGSIEPLGDLANKELRKLRSEAHTVFDIIWKNNKESRSSAYAWLAESLKIDKAKCHIGMFDISACIKTIELAQLKGEL